jgi:hypothetical protein
MRAVKRGADLLFKDPVAAWKKYCDVKPAMKTRLNALQFDRSYNYMSVDLANVQRDWNKVGLTTLVFSFPSLTPYLTGHCVLEEARYRIRGLQAEHDQRVPELGTRGSGKDRRRRQAVSILWFCCSWAP